MALTKAEIVDHLSHEIGINKREAREIVELFFKTIAEALTKGQQVKLSGFGNFNLHDKNERPGRNPKTGEKIPVSARRVTTFRSGQKLRARVSKYEASKENENSEK